MRKLKIKKYLGLILALTIMFSNTIALASNEVKQEANEKSTETHYEEKELEINNIKRDSNEEVSEKTLLEEIKTDIVPLANQINQKEGVQGYDINTNNIIDSKEKLIDFINKGTVTNEEYVIKGRIEINSDELPSTKLNVKGCRITGDSAEIVINTVNGKLPKGIFGTIENYESGNTYPSGGYGEEFRDIAFSYVSDLKIIYNGDVEKYTFAEGLKGKVYESEEGSSIINNIDIVVNGNILADKSDVWKNISGFVIDCYGFDLNNIHVHVTGNIGEDVEYSGLVGVQGLFTDSGGEEAPTRLNNSSVIVDGKMIAKAEWALAGGLTVNDIPVIANNVKSEIRGGIEVKSTGEQYNSRTPYYSGASVGFLNNHGEDIVTDNGFLSLNIKINKWVKNEIHINLGGSPSQITIIPKDVRKDFVNVIPEEDIVPRKAGQFPEVPRVDNGVFKTKSIDVDSVTNAKIAGAAYYMAGTENKVNIDNISAAGVKESIVAGYGGYNKNGEKINVEIGDINFIKKQNSNSDKFSVFGSTVNDIGTSNSSVKVGNISGVDKSTKAPTYVYVGGWSNTSTKGENNTVNIGDIDIEGIGNNHIAGYTRNAKDTDIKNCEVFLGNVAVENGNGINKFSGFANNIINGTISNSKCYVQNVTLAGGQGTQPMLNFGGFAGSNKGNIDGCATLINGNINLSGGLWITNLGGFAESNNGTIKDSSTQILGDLKVNEIRAINDLKIGGFVGDITAGALNNNTVLVFGRIGEFPIKQLNQVNQPVGLFAAYSKDANINSNAVYFSSEEIDDNEKLEICFVGSPKESFIENNTVLVDKSSYIQVNNLLPLNNTDNSVEKNYFIEVDQGLRTAYPYNENILTKTEEDIIGEIEVAGRSFQETYWNKGAKPEQDYSNFKYVVKNKDVISLNSYGQNRDISNSPFKTGSLKNFYDRHMAIQNNGITYDIFGIKGGDITEPTKPTKPGRPTGTIKEITLVGGRATLTERVESQLMDFVQYRLSGKDRYGTSVDVAKEYSKSNIVLLASGEKYTDELTATVLANKLGAPIMLTRKDAIPAEVKAEINRLGATKVILIGGNASISEKVEKELANYTVERIGGPDRYDTAILVGNQVRALTASKTEAILVDGTNFPDAIAMTSMGVEQNMPILLTKPGQLPASTAKTIEDWKLTKVTIGGGSKSVSGEVEKEVRKYAEVNRIAGADRYETSVLVAEQVYVKPKHAVIASGEVFPDAIVGAPYAAKKSYPIVLSRGNNVPDVVMDYVLGNR